MSDEELKKRMALLEFAYDQLIKEVSQIDKLMRKIGFANGIHTLKFAAEELIARGQKLGDL